MKHQAALFLFLGGLCLSAASACAQSVYGFSTLTIDPSTNIITATCETDLDPELEGYYQPTVGCLLKDDGGNILASDQDIPTDDEQSVSVTVEYQGQPGTSYVVTGRHAAVVELQQDDPDPGDDGRGQNTQNLIDAYNFQQYTTISDSQGQVIFHACGCNYISNYNWFGPGPETNTRQHTIVFPNTTEGGAITPSVNIKFSGSKSANDTLQFAAFNPSSPCTEILGLQNCPSYWHWQIEGSAQVRDASQWIVQQHVDSGYQSGTLIDSNGQTSTLPLTQATPGLDGPDPSFLQANAGANQLFWIDGPGPQKVVDSTHQVNSVTSVRNFSVQVCSFVISGGCGTANWYVKIVVDAGGLLNFNTSAAGFGTAP